MSSAKTQMTIGTMKEASSVIYPLNLRKHHHPHPQGQERNKRHFGLFPNLFKYQKNPRYQSAGENSCDHPHNRDPRSKRRACAQNQQPIPIADALPTDKGQKQEKHSRHQRHQYIRSIEVSPVYTYCHFGKRHTKASQYFPQKYVSAPYIPN